MSTPIRDLQGHGDTPMNYQDAMHDALQPTPSNDVQVPAQMPMQEQLPQMPMVQQYPSFSQTTGPKPLPQQAQTPDFQKEALVIFVLCTIVYSQATQSVIERHFPNLFENGRVTLVGAVILAGIVSFLFVVSKNVKIGLQ